MAKVYRCTVTNSNAASAVEGEASPLVSADGTQRAIFGCDEFGRGVAVMITPLSADTQFVIQSIAATVIPSIAGSDDA